MNNKIILAIAAVVMVAVSGALIYIFTMSNSAAKLEKAKGIARNWILLYSATYRFDGYDLKYREGEFIDPKWDNLEKFYKFTFDFKSSQAGYGDRTGQFLAQVITPHYINIAVSEKGEVIEAITDEKYDEMKREFLAPIGELIKVKVFFGNTILDPEVMDCQKNFPVDREIAKTQAVGRAALEQLLQGPTAAERAQGYITSINPGVRIQSLTIENGIARVDFAETLEASVGGSCRVTAIRSQISNTLKQFPTVTSVIISINGRTEDILQP